MGDVAMTVPILLNLVKQHPELKLTVVSKPFFEPLFKDIPSVNFFPVDVKNRHKGFVGLYKLFKEIKKLNITHVADLHNVLRSKIIRFFFRLTNTPTAQIDKGRKEKKELTKQAKKTRKPLKSSHQRYADVFFKLGFPIQLSPNSKKPPIISKKTAELTDSKALYWIGIAPFAAFEGKTYPIHLMKQVVEELSKQPVKIMFFGGGKEEINQLENIAVLFPNTINLAGKLSFEEELSVISQLDLMISMDSGNGHLAAMFGVETLTVWGVTHPFAGFVPYNQPEKNQILPDLNKYPLLPCSVFGKTVFKGYEKVMESIHPSNIIEKSLQILNLND